MSAVEIVGFVLTLLAISLATRGYVLTWPLQIIASLLYVYLFLSVNLFGESLLQLIYAGVAIYGWFNWGKQKSEGKSLQVSKLSKKEWLLINAIAVFLMLLVAQFQVQFLPTDVPYLDSSVFIFGLLAQWMQANKKIENWLYWIVLDLIAAGIYWYKDLHLTSVLYLILTCLAYFGWLQWRKTVR
jgi:nicotinamide mononucleotide transporter